MSNSNILLGPKYSSSTFEEELENTFLDDFLVAANKRRFNDVYLIHASTNEILNSKIFVEQSYNVAAELQSFGCNRDSRTLVGILSENRLEYPIVILGTLLTGAALICYNPAFTDEDLRREFKNTKLTILFCSPEHYNNLKRIAHPPTKIIVFDSKTSLDASPYLKFSQLSQSTTKAYSDPGPRRTDDLAFVLYTSGTTGTPKGVMLTHKNMVYMLKLLTEEKLMEVRGLKSVSIAPMFHAYGLISLLFAIPESRTLFIMPTFDERLFHTGFRYYYRQRHVFIFAFQIDASTNEKLMSKEFVNQSYNVAAELQYFGCDRNTLVGILSENRLEYPTVVLGTLLTGAALTCYNPAYTIEELRLVYEIAKPTILFCSPQNYNNLTQIAPPSAKIIVFDSKKSLDASPYLKFSQLSQSTRAYHRIGPRRTDDVTFVLYSSGTTGLPKGVMLTHKNMVYLLKLLTEEKLMEVSGLTGMVIAPMFHAYGLNNLLSAIPENQTLVFMPRFEERLFLSTIQKYKIRQLRLVPTLIMYLLKDPKVNEYDLSSLESASCGAAPLKIETEEAFKEKFGLKYVQQGYGMTECTLITSIKKVQSTKPASCGSVVPGAQLKIVDLTTKETLGKNKAGEICIRGPHVMKGYFGNPKATFDTLDGEGWLHSGDVGYYDEDEELFIVDRVKELIKYKGFQVAPAELEALLLTHPKIADCGVIGIPDDVAGGIPRAYVVKGSDAEVTEEEIIQFVEGRVSPQKRLRGGVEFVSEIPKNPTGKILRRQLRELWTLKQRKSPPDKLSGCMEFAFRIRAYLISGIVLWRKLQGMLLVKC